MKTLPLKLDLSTVTVDTGDERLGLPSASGANILAHCPGAWRMQQGRPEIGRFKDDASRGQKIHRALAGEDVLLEHDERQDVDALEENCAALVDAWSLERSELGKPYLQSADAERLHLRVGLAPVTTGQFDRLYFQEAESGELVRALIVDFKSGWQELGSTASNMQLLVYALLVSAQYPDLEEIAVALVRPIDKKPHWFTYRETQLASAAQLWERVLREAFGERPALVAGSHCTFCKAQDVCPARRAQLATFHVDEDVLAAQWAAMTPTAKYDLYVASVSAAKLCDVIKDNVKRELERNDGAIPGLYLKPGAINKTITDADGALARVLANGGTREDFLPAVSVSFAKIRDALAERLKWKKKDADGIAKALLDGTFVTTQNNPSIKIA